jgi:hypothetical protein
MNTLINNLMNYCVEILNQYTQQIFLLKFLEGRSDFLSRNILASRAFVSIKKILFGHA